MDEGLWSNGVRAVQFGRVVLKRLGVRESFGGCEDRVGEWVLNREWYVGKRE